MQNRLAGETSPYLLQHKDNPVHWQPWDETSLDQAKRENKPILLSIGYAACHWCHVMAHESFEAGDTAEMMNTHFVNIKVDREERPDLDVIYQTALGLLGEHGGWPLTMFLTPEGEPFWGGTYFPPSASYGRPAFTDVLANMADAYRSQKDKVLENVSALKQAMTQMTKIQGGEGLNLHLLDEAAKSAARMVDPVEGGTVGAPKFPQVSFFTFLWRAHRRTTSPAFREAVTLTLSKMCQGGIYDHLGGGFARYSTDEIWLAPHFEKMLYDNALLVDLLCEVGMETGDPVYAQRVRETIGWCLREMRVGEMRVAKNGVSDETKNEPFAFASALDADSEGVEGKFYVWDEQEIDDLLGSDAALFKERYGITRRGNWEGKNILTRRLMPEFADEDTEAALSRCRKTLFDARANRIRPGRDDKVLADWNGLMISALARAGSLLDEPDWIAAARSVFSFVCMNMIENGRLCHSWCDGRARHAAVLDDYANMSRAAIQLYEITNDPSYLDQAEAWVDVANRRYWDEEGLGYFFTADDTRDIITRTKTIADNATLSGNGVMVEVLARLYLLCGRDEYRERWAKMVRLFSVSEPRHLINMPTFLNGFELLERPVQIAVVGEEGAEDADALHRTALQSAPVVRVVMRVQPGAPLPDGHPATGKGLIDGRAAAYICVGAACGMPVTGPEALKEALKKL